MTKQTAKLASTDLGFKRGMARELLIHNPQINTVTDALNLAQELITATKAEEDDLSQLAWRLRRDRHAPSSTLSPIRIDNK